MDRFPPPLTDGRRRRLLGAMAAAPLALQAGHARAEQWPARQIRLVLPSGAGGGSDIFGRPMAQFFSSELKVPVVVENKPGANGILAHEAVVRQPADGYSLVISYSAALIVNKLMNRKMSHDPVADLQPIGRIGGGGGNALIVHPSVPAKNLAELVAYAKAKRDLSYASWGIGSGGHLFMEMIKKHTGMPINHVPYKTVAQIPPDLITGVVPVAWIDSATPVALVRSGKARVIATASQERLPQFPDTPTLGEQGIAFKVQSWYGLFAPRGLPPEVLARLNAVLNKWLTLPETIAYFKDKQNAPAPVPTTPDEYAKVIAADVEGWRQLIADGGASAG